MLARASGPIFLADSVGPDLTMKTSSSSERRLRHQPIGRRLVGRKVDERFPSTSGADRRCQFLERVAFDRLSVSGCRRDRDSQLQLAEIDIDESSLRLNRDAFMFADNRFELERDGLRLQIATFHHTQDAQLFFFRLSRVLHRFQQAPLG